MALTTPRRAARVEYCADTVISTAQNAEDVLLFRAFRGKRNGFYIDIGAGDPNWDSVTNWFYRLGWRGVNIEPNPILYQTLAQWRPQDINLNVGIADQAGELTYHQVIANDVGWGWGLSSFDPAAEISARKLGFEVRHLRIGVTTLLAVVQRHCVGRKIDFLKIDVEGFEAPIICSTDWRLLRPTVLCIEAMDINGAPTFEAWEPHLLRHGYHFAIFDGTNNYYVTEEREDVLTQFNAGINSHDRYRKAETADFVLPGSAAR